MPDREFILCFENIDESIKHLFLNRVLQSGFKLEKPDTNAIIAIENMGERVYFNSESEVITRLNSGQGILVWGDLDNDFYLSFSRDEYSDFIYIEFRNCSDYTEWLLQVFFDFCQMENVRKKLLVGIFTHRGGFDKRMDDYFFGTAPPLDYWPEIVLASEKVNHEALAQNPQMKSVNFHEMKLYYHPLMCEGLTLPI